MAAQMNPWDDTSQGTAKPQVQDQWGRSPGDVNYGKDPASLGGPQRQTSDPNAPGYDPGFAGPQSGGLSTSSAALGNGWSQYATDPKSFQYGLQQALSQGKQGEDAIAWMNSNGWAGAQNPAGGGIQYYPESGQFGLPGGYKVVPGANGKLDIYQAGDGGGQASAPATPSLLATPTPEATTQGAGGAGTTTAPSTAATTASTLASTPSKSEALYQMLLDRAKQGENVNPNDPVLRNQTDAFNAQQQQARRNYLSETAERQGPSGNIDAESRASAEQVGQNTSGFQAQLVQRELQSKRDEIQQALTQMGAQLSDEQRQALQQKLAEMDNALQYARLNEQGSEFGQSIGLQNRQLSQQEEQFLKTLGQRAFEYDTTRQDSVLQ